MQSIDPTAEQSRSRGQPAARQFEWRLCPKHSWLQVSVLVVPGLAPLCMPEGGRPHVVDRTELEDAA